MAHCVLRHWAICQDFVSCPPVNLSLHYSQEHLINCFIVFLSYYFFLKFHPAKPPWLLFVFVLISTGHAHFTNDEMLIPWIPMRSSMLFFSCRMPEK